MFKCRRVAEEDLVQPYNGVHAAVKKRSLRDDMASFTGCIAK